jgi:hypothetical protein
MTKDYTQHRFPVKTATSCQLKWAWSTIYLSKSSTASCHRVKHQRFSAASFEKFHNNAKKLEDRKKMLNGERPSGGCEYCYNIEDAGGVSDRMIHLDEDTVPYEMQFDPNAIEVTPSILEIYFNNICNLKCVYCGPWFSSQIAGEYHKFGPFKKEGVDLNGLRPWTANPEYNVMRDFLFDWLKLHSFKLKRFQILGGEPFYQKEFIDCLDHFDQYPNPELTFVVITNLMVDDKRMDYYIDKFRNLLENKKIKVLQIVGSLDCWGKQSEYIRNGLDLELWERNFSKLVNLGWIRLQVNLAITPLSIPHTYDLIARINEWRKIQPIYMNFMSVQDPPYLNPNIFGNIFAEDFEKIISIMPEDSDINKNFKNYMIGISKETSSKEPNVQQIKNLKIYLDELDRRRHTNYKALWPWLDDQFAKHQVNGE